MVGLGLIGIGGTVVDAAEPPFRPSRIPLVGRTTTICTVTPPPSGERPPGWPRR